MCSEGVARAFRQSYPVVAACSIVACLYVVSTAPPLHVEAYSTSALPINGTLQAGHSPNPHTPL